MIRILLVYIKGISYRNNGHCNMCDALRERDTMVHFLCTVSYRNLANEIAMKLHTQQVPKIDHHFILLVNL